MTMLTQVITLMILILSTETSVSKVIDDIKYLSNLFSVTASEVYNIIHNFKFINVPNENVTFLQYFPSNQTLPINTSSTLNLRQPTKIIIHGWTSNGKSEWIRDMAYRLHQTGHLNVIAIDWGITAAYNYTHAAGSTRSIGTKIGNFLHLNNITKVHIIAHSLGAHIAGFAGKTYKQLSNKVLDRISALDPASPLFELSSIQKRMDRTDAKFVDVIHTQIGIRGIMSPIGDVDCYVNGGIIQPKCMDKILNPSDFVSCGHAEAHYLYRQSISQPQKYKGLQCSGLLRFGKGLCDGNRIELVGYGAKAGSQGKYYMNVDKNGNVIKP